jgi:Uma2 family endonuclease
MSVVLKSHYTPEQYLEMERRAEVRHEFVNGEIFAMAGGTASHSRITINTIIALDRSLEGRPCVTYDGNLRVLVDDTGLYTYPDVTVACGTPIFLDDRQDTLRNPSVIFEILSSSTESYDRRAKFAHYKWISSLTDYVLIAQDQVRVEHFTRPPHDGDWPRTVLTGPGDTLSITSIGCTVRIADIYRQITFDAPQQL